MLHNAEKLKIELQNSIQKFKEEIKTLSTGKANVETLQNISVEAYGSVVTLQTLGQVVVNDAINVTISIWDKGVIQAVDKSLREAGLGASVAVDKDVIRLKYNPMTEEDRKMVVKKLGDVLERGRVAIRQIRHDFLKPVKDMQGVSEDDQDISEKAIQKEVDSAIKQIEELADKKESEIMKL